MINYHLAIDIGASSGRHILFWKENGTIKNKEIYRFKNQLIKKKHLCWDIDYIFNEVKKGIHKCKEINTIPSTIAIDTWGCDFVIVDGKGKRIGECVSYRDKRTKGIAEEAFKVMTKEELYKFTGIQTLEFNSLFQLIALNKELEFTSDMRLLMIPDYLNYLLTGVMANEYTNATTTQLIDVKTKSWCMEILENFNLPQSLFGEINYPQSLVGMFTMILEKELGFNTKVVLCGSHDTASAFMSVTDEESIIISSGTWSLLGVNLSLPILNSKALNANYTNEGGINGIRFLKNIMGLWMIQEIKRETDIPYSFDDITKLARKSNYFKTVINVNDSEFLNPYSMREAIKDYCVKRSLKEPQTIGETFQCVLLSLAVSYNESIKELEDILEKNYPKITIIGGGSKNTYLNELIESICNKRVEIGESEATALGNALTQLKDI